MPQGRSLITKPILGVDLTCMRVYDGGSSSTCCRNEAYLALRTQLTHLSRAHIVLDEISLSLRYQKCSTAARKIENE
jgi:hypothetical protein